MSKITNQIVDRWENKLKKSYNLKERKKLKKLGVGEILVKNLYVPVHGSFGFHHLKNLFIPEYMNF